MAKTATALKLLDGQLQELAEPFLAGEGFTRAGKNRLWLRGSSTAKDVNHLVWFQVGESASTLGGRFTAEVGLYYPKYDRFRNGRELAGPLIGSCHFDMRRRVGMFLSKPEDKWWPYKGSAETVAKEVNAVLQLLRQYGLPWLLSADTPANAAIFNTGKLPEPDRLRREAYERQMAAGKTRKSK